MAIWLDGSGVGVAVIDSGVTSKDDLMMADGMTPRIVNSGSFIRISDTTTLMAMARM